MYVYLAVFPSFLKEGKPEGKGGFVAKMQSLCRKIGLCKEAGRNPRFLQCPGKRSTPEKEELLAVPWK
ncbi:MAG: hypothetical protein BRC23_01400 [Parcubacteria group bacterium SW_4_49_11]|nr:MAG: hypothetical protein BRC23_01400 [Parcubacteria group bacterium SW_4_49_11]